MVSQHHPGNIYNNFLPKKLFLGYSCKYPVLNHVLVICSCEFNILFYYFLYIVHYRPQGIKCNDGPQVYREWLGIQYVNPWINVKRCINYRCKPSVKKLRKVTPVKRTGLSIITVIQHINCTNY